MTAVPTRSRMIGVDLGGTKIVAALVDHTGQVTHRCRVPTPAREGREAVMRALLNLLRRTADQAPPGVSVEAIGIGTAGVVDRGGVIAGSTDAIPGWAGAQIAATVHREMGAPVRVVNDVVAFLLGELRFGAAKDARNVLAVTVGTGIGGAVLIDGHLLHGHRNVAGHVGHAISPAATGRLCSCGRTGHVEAVASGPAIAADYARRRGRSGLTLHEVTAAEREGDPLAREALAQAGTALGVTLGGLVNVLAPELVLGGGGVIAHAPTVLHALLRAVPTCTIQVLSDVRVTSGELGADAALLGAAELARRGRDEEPP